MTAVGAEDLRVVSTVFAGDVNCLRVVHLHHLDPVRVGEQRLSAGEVEGAGARVVGVPCTEPKLDSV